MENGDEGGEEEEEREEEGKEEEEEEEEDDKEDRPPSLLWLMKKLSLMAKREAAYAPKVPLKVNLETLLSCVFLNPVMIWSARNVTLFVLHCDFSQRTCVFKFLGAMAMDLGKERLTPYLTTIITPLYRELDSTYADQGNCSEPVLPRIKKTILTKSVRFTEWPLLSPNLWSRSHTEEPRSGAHRADEETGGPGEILPGLLCRPEGILTETSGTQTTQSHAGMMDIAMRHTRETALICHRSSSQFLLRSPQAVANPDIAAKKKLKKHKNKIEAKKRKIEFLRPGYKAKKQRSHALKDLAMVQWAEDARRGWKLGQLMQNRLKRKHG